MWCAMLLVALSLLAPPQQEGAPVLGLAALFDVVFAPFCIATIFCGPFVVTVLQFQNRGIVPEQRPSVHSKHGSPSEAVK